MGIINEEERKMKTTATTFRNVLCFLTLMALSVVLAACGSGGGTSSNPSGTASVNVSLAAAPAFPTGTVFTASPAAVEGTAKPVSPVFDNVFVNIVKVALLPADGGEGPDPNGETMGPDDERDRGNGFVTAIVDPPGTIDLLHLPSGRKIARFLDKFVNVPAGTYGKIRIYYSDLWGVRGTEVIPFHPTAHSHFDVHFVNGNLVIPVAPDPERGIHLYDVTIHFVGLKIVENKNKVLMRPQVFAVADDVLYSVSGRAGNVESGEFDVFQDDAGVSPVHVTYDGTTKWSFRDPAEGREVNDVGTANGTAALRDSAKVKAIGMFSGDDLAANEIIVSFDDFLQQTVVSGNATSGWTALDTLELNLPSDNVVFPQPSRTSAVYDNAISSAHEFLFDTDVVKGITVKARGYFVTVGTRGIDAFWISVGGP
jgi:hypothetical protein